MIHRADLNWRLYNAHLNNGSSSHSPNALGYDVEDSFKEADVTGDEKAHSHGRINVASTDMSKGLKEKIGEKLIIQVSLSWSCWGIQR